MWLKTYWIYSTQTGYFKSTETKIRHFWALYRPIHVYCYSSEPITCEPVNRSISSEVSIPIRLSYHRGSHYSSHRPNQTAIGVGFWDYLVWRLGSTSPTSRRAGPEREHPREADAGGQDQLHRLGGINEVIEERWPVRATGRLPEQEKARNNPRGTPLRPLWPLGRSFRGSGGSSSSRPWAALDTLTRPPSQQDTPPPRPPGAGNSFPRSGTASPKAGCSSDAADRTGQDSPKPGSSRSTAVTAIGPQAWSPNFSSWGKPPPFLMDYLQMSRSGWVGVQEDSVLQVLAESQQEYLNSLQVQVQGQQGEGARLKFILTKFCWRVWDGELRDIVYASQRPPLGLLEFCGLLSTPDMR